MYRTKTSPVTGRRALYLIAENKQDGRAGQFFRGRILFELKAFVFVK